MTKKLQHVYEELCLCSVFRCVTEGVIFRAFFCYCEIPDEKLFEKRMTLKIGTPISYKLGEDEIIRQWAKQIADFTGFENKVEAELIQNQESVPQPIA